MVTRLPSFWQRAKWSTQASASSSPSHGSWLGYSTLDTPCALQVIARLCHHTLTRAFLAWRSVLLHQGALSSSSGAIAPPRETPDQSEDGPGDAPPATWHVPSPEAQLSPAFSAWRGEVRRARRLRALAARAVRRWRQRSVAAAFQALAEHVRAQRARRAGLMAVCSRRWAVQSCVGLALERWRTATLAGRNRRLRASLAAAEAAAEEGRKLQRQSAQEQ
jgi:hypothetical protein